jgi:hypothetical protein
MNAELTVYFTCPHCDLVYQATQTRTMRQSSGQFVCAQCRGLVHAWRGIYTYPIWEPVAGQEIESKLPDTSRLHH